MKYRNVIHNIGVEKEGGCHKDQRVEEIVFASESRVKVDSTEQAPPCIEENATTSNPKQSVVMHRNREEREAE